MTSTVSYDSLSILPLDAELPGRLLDGVGLSTSIHLILIVSRETRRFIQNIGLGTSFSS